VDQRDAVDVPPRGTQSEEKTRQLTKGRIKK